ncbi:NADH dehydrogenase (ubiquinone) 13 kDa A subunit [Oratosquilla oratoria]|uniref:NADH dehydrogenase (ubiquinone) 13 kDa A subunit n=1 Tax=Oratosquilla oratoria TaxID=337810 RepID=UPI003F76C3BD
MAFVGCRVLARNLSKGSSTCSPLKLVRAVHTTTINHDVPTHTGQDWNEDDARQARFTYNPRQTNTRWAMDLIKEVPPKVVNTRIAICEGHGTGPLGHPKIYINVDKPGVHSCIYCGLRYTKEDAH